MADPAIPPVLFLDQSGVMGGAEHSLLDLVTRRREAGADDLVVLLADGPFAERLRAAGVAVEVLPLSIDVPKAAGSLSQLAAAPRVASIAWSVARLARRRSILYANTQKAAVVGAAAAKLALRPLVWHLRDLLDADHFSPANRRAAVLLTNNAASRVVANSEATAAAYRRAGGRVPTTVVYNGIDGRPFSELNEQSARGVRESVGAAAAPLLGVFGRLTPWKGQHALLDALADERLAGVHAAIVGEALFTDEDRRYADTLKVRSTQPPLVGRVHWLGQRDDVPALMRACDIVVHTSVQPEPFGRVIVEGQLAGRPVLATAAGGTLEIIEDGVTGVLTPPGDAGRLADAIHHLLADPARAQRIAAAGRESALRRFRLEDRVREINAVLAEVARRR